MLALLSPAKNLDFAPKREGLETTRPALSADTARLAAVTKKLTAADLKRLMGISDKLAELNVARFQAFRTRGRAESQKAAALAFNGEVYLGLQAETLSDGDLQYAQDHLRILSGLYGLLRPLDAIQPYRLEMGTKLKTEVGGDLYAFWGDRIAKELNKALKASGSDTVINLASNEYFKAVDPNALKARIITPKFKDEKDGKLRSLMYFAKRARGAMARAIIKNRLETPEALKAATVEGYAFAPDLSGEDEWVFTRPQPAAKAA